MISALNVYVLVNCCILCICYYEHGHWQDLALRGGQTHCIVRQGVGLVEIITVRYQSIQTTPGRRLEKFFWFLGIKGFKIFISMLIGHNKAHSAGEARGEQVLFLHPSADSHGDDIESATFPGLSPYTVNIWHSRLCKSASSPSTSSKADTLLKR